MNIMKIMQQAGKMKSKMQEMQLRMHDEAVTGEAGGGAVKITLNGSFYPQEVKLDKSVVNPADIELLEDLIKTAIGNAHQKTSAMVEGETKKIMKELGLPENMEMPF